MTDHISIATAIETLIDTAINTSHAPHNDTHNDAHNGAPNGATNGAANGATNGAANGASGDVTPRRHAPYPPAKPGGYGADGAGHDTRRHTAAINGAPNGANTRAPLRQSPVRTIGANGAPDRETILARLEEAGRTLLALPPTGWTTKLRTSNIDVVRSAAESYGYNTSARLRPAMPDSQAITRMDEALAWLTLIPRDRYVLRRIVGARALISPLTDKHLYPWRRLATLLGADHKAIQRWHAQGITIIHDELKREAK